MDQESSLLSLTLSDGTSMLFDMLYSDEGDLSDVLHAALHQKIVVGADLATAYRAARAYCRTGWTPQLTLDVLVLACCLAGRATAYDADKSPLAILYEIVRKPAGSDFLSVIEDLVMLDASEANETYFDIIEPSFQARTKKVYQDIPAPNTRKRGVFLGHD